MTSSPLVHPEAKEFHQSRLPGASKVKEGAKAGPGQLYLRIKVPAIAPNAHQPLLLPMDCIQEVLSLPVQRLSPMPGMPSPVLGLMNRGNRVFWLADLSLLLGLSRLEPNPHQHNVLIVRAGGAALGLAVSEVQPVVWIADAQLQPDVTLLNAQLHSFVSHLVNHDETLFWRLNSQNLLQAAMLQPRLVQPQFGV